MSWEVIGHILSVVGLVYVIASLFLAVEMFNDSEKGRELFWGLGRSVGAILCVTSTAYFGGTLVLFLITSAVKALMFTGSLILELIR